MNEPAQGMEGLRGLVEARWDPARARRVLDGVKARARRRRRVRLAARAVLGAAVVAALVGTGLVWRGERERSLTFPASTREQLAPTRMVRAADGSTATPLDATTRMKVSEAPGLVRVELERDAARFEVTRDPRRTFRVEAGLYVVEVIGTRFVVDRREGGDVHVSVERGKVRVRGPGGSERILEAGDARLFAAVPVVGWRELALAGDHEGARRVMATGFVSIGDDPGDLLLAADVARATHHPQEAAELLRRVAQGRPDDARAPLAAFALGRVLLEELDDTAGAAAAFALSRKLHESGPLVEDALAREVEARARVGQRERAATLAREYLRRWPEGRRASAVRTWGGLP